MTVNSNSIHVHMKPGNYLGTDLKLPAPTGPVVVRLGFGHVFATQWAGLIFLLVFLKHFLSNEYIRTEEEVFTKET